MGELLTEEVKGWIGREVTYTAPEELGRAAIRYFANAVGDDNLIYLDDEAARSSGHSGVIAPPTLVCETSQYMSDSHKEGGHSWDLPIAGCRTIRGGNEYTFSRRVQPNDVITARWRIEDIQEKETSAAVPMLIVTSVVTYTNQSQDILATNRETLIYQRLEPS
jgi:acyl dehydratase